MLLVYKSATVHSVLVGIPVKKFFYFVEWSGNVHSWDSAILTCRVCAPCMLTSSHTKKGGAEAYCSLLQTKSVVVVYTSSSREFTLVGKQDDHLDI